MKKQSLLKKCMYGVALMVMLVSAFGITKVTAQNNVPTGAINGKFTVNANGDQVYFSQGNLQYQASTNTWRFAENQWNFVGTQDPDVEGYSCGNVSGSDNANISSTYSGWIDLYGWGTSGHDHGAVCYQPWSTSETNSDYYAYGSYTNNLNDQTGLADWGCNPISNGGNQPNQWRTLSKEEWEYVIDLRQTSSGIHYAKAEVNGVRGVVLLPDNWDASIYVLIGANQGITEFAANTISLSDWCNMEANGAVFLPVTGLRCEGITIGYYEVNGDYWSTTVLDDSQAYTLGFDNSNVTTAGWPQYRFNGRSVRLVRSAQANTTYSIECEPNPIKGGTITGAGDFELNATCTLTATANEGYVFTNWTENDEMVSNDPTYFFTVTGDRDLVANFIAQGEAPVGAVQGLFSVGEDSKVYFSQGNLQYQASTNTWRFAENQWDYVMDGGNNNASPTFDGWIDLFAWGTSGYNHGAVCYQPWSISAEPSDYYAYGDWQYNLYDQNGQADWGYNPISNGGNSENSYWRTLKADEWDYLFNTRITASGIRYAWAVVNDINGLILVPDNWDVSYYTLNNTNTVSSDFSSNIISNSEWNELEQHGAIFLPGATWGNGGHYWSASIYNENTPYFLFFFPGQIQTKDVFNNRNDRFSVRLAHLAQAVTSYSIEAVPNPAEGGTVTGTGSYQQGQTCTLTATANTGYNFVNWTENGTEVSNSAIFSFNVTGNRNLVANFIVHDNTPTGAINGKFAINENGDQVYFSQGNLQYIGSASIPYWKFADNQWEYLGDNGQFSTSQDVDRDLFCYGTSGYNHGAVCYQPWSTSTNNNDYWAYGNSTSDLFDQTGKADWGYNAINNGGNEENLWRTMTISEWDYVLNIRSTTSGIRFARAKVNNVCGVILLPDDWETNIYELNNFNSGNYDDNIISAEDWTNFFEANGAVLLPVTGLRTGVSCIEGRADYWSSSHEDEDWARGIIIDYGDFNLNGLHYRHDAKSVRLIRPVQATTSYSIDAVPNPAEGGTITGTGSYQQGQTCTLAATANEGYTFVNWTKNNEVVSSSTTYTFTVTGNRNLVANFSEIIVPTTNHWIPETESFEDNMTFTAVIQIDGVEQYSPMLEVGAFCGEQCRGSQLAALFEPTQRYLVQLTIFGEINDLISFRLFDHATEQELDLSSPAPVNFSTNGYGTLANPYALNFTSAITQAQALNNGWNWWSTYVETEGNNALEQLENSLGDNGLLIKSRNNGYAEPYNDNGTILWYGTLSALQNEQTYKINTNSPCVASITGLPVNPDNHPITLKTGWNWIGFPSTQNVSVATALSGLDAAPDDIIKGRNGYASYYAENGYNGWYGTINTLESGQGYMYRSNSNNSKTFTYTMGRGETTQANITPDQNLNMPQADRFADNMTVTAVVKLEGTELRSETYEVAAFVGNECRGSVKLMYVAPIDRYVAFLAVFGEPGDELSFHLTDGVDTSLSEEGMTFVTDGSVGSLSNPATLRFGTLGVDESLSNSISIYPNPSEGLFLVKGQGMKNVAVFNVYGQCVLSEAINSDELTIDMRHLANGIYTLRVITNSGVLSSTIVKQ